MVKNLETEKFYAFNRFFDFGTKQHNFDLLEKYTGFFGENIFVSAIVGKNGSGKTPLKMYTMLYEYAADAESEYEDFLKARKIEVQKKKASVSTSEVKSTGISKTIQNGEKSVYIENNNGSVII